MHALVQQVDAAIRARDLLAKGESALIAVSGGVDSMALLHVLSRLAPARGWNLAAAHFNHRLRGRSADADARLAQRSCEALDVKCEMGAADVKEFASARGLSVEMAARELRHAFLAQTARALGIKKIALAHHADDQVELFLLRLLRGSSSLGLGGMHWLSPSPSDPAISLIRPLLECRKGDLVTFAAETKVRFREDSTNTSADILRNRIRHKLLPLLRRDYQPGIDPVLLRQADLLREDADYLLKESQTWLSEVNCAFSDLPVALQRRALHLQLMNAGIQPDYWLVERLRNQPSQWVTVSPSLNCRRLPSGGIETQPIRAVAPFLPGELKLQLSDRGDGEFDGAMLSWKVIRSSRRPARKPQRESFDADAVGREIVLRHWREGDRFQPIGMGRAVKLQDLFVNAKIQRDFRSKATIGATLEGEIFWVEGLRISEKFKVGPSTRRRLDWQWRRAMPIT